ncbi:SWIM zinc finger family protein [Sphaerotilus sp.]|uniref:SWIM zinc finger family protein n=1 Tax=Sphaerotilus sp. TaxID=2093942 RepID=UPI002ACE9028|nr:SWIM zinc finger family protein [Sphaerotilus sp.]MDZ7856988.1 SWIM zinc finger family protein [Sphaerotilus sp.]
MTTATVLTTEAVLALAPDAASAKAARGLLAPATWPTLGHDAAAAWGECQGSGSKPYQTQVDLSGPVFKCSCPSRKFPCKHGLALLLLRAQDTSRFTTPAEPPEWVRAWLEGRRERAEKQEQKQQPRPQPPQAAAGVTATATANGADPAAPPTPDTTTARQDKRWQRIEAGLEELARWLADRVQRGLAVQTREGAGEWQTMAARMVDAQAGALAGWLTAAGAESDNAARLARLGRLQLLIEAVQRRAALDAGVLADVRATLGWPLERDEVLARGEAVDDVWRVDGQIVEEREQRLVERRVWLSGRRSGRRALLLDFSHGTAGFETSWITGQARAGRLVFFPSVAPLRALSVQREAVPEADEEAVEGEERLAAGWDDELDRAAAAMAAHAWLPLWPLRLAGATIRVVDDAVWACGDPHALPLNVPTEQVPTLLALAGGGRVDLNGEWDGRTLRLLTLRSDEGRWQIGRTEGATR